ncbi:hypothetical protein [Marinimicrobium agarilyticum]|uniref:hypothetical protein n=1 Tax=Marinimicrobium agarilyticum TaxID=306546 RepID=UPI000568A4EC|nr:hypothetical protein [Marinimicrobium agarilyticum]
MNINELVKSAKALEVCFQKTGNLPAKIAGLYGDLKPYIEKSKNGELDAPMAKSKVPGAHLFNDGELRPYPDLERAYARFRMQLSGGLSKKQEKVLEEIRRM